MWCFIHLLYLLKNILRIWCDLYKWLIYEVILDIFSKIVQLINYFNKLWYVIINL